LAGIAVRILWLGNRFQPDVIHLGPAADINRLDPLKEDAGLGVLEVLVQMPVMGVPATIDKAYMINRLLSFVPK
jgi:hypothetical protein